MGGGGGGSNALCVMDKHAELGKIQTDLYKHVMEQLVMLPNVIQCIVDSCQALAVIRLASKCQSVISCSCPFIRALFSPSTRYEMR